LLFALLCGPGLLPGASFFYFLVTLSFERAQGSRSGSRLSLPLLKAGILLVDDVQLALAAYNLAIRASFLDGCSYFHILWL